MATCKDCRFFAEHPPAVRSDNGYGYCQRFPKRVSVADAYWCGEFSGKRPGNAVIPRNANNVRFGQVNR